VVQEVAVKEVAVNDSTRAVASVSVSRKKLWVVNK
jgi:hypothetical protein